MTRQEMREFAASQVTWHENQNKWLMDRIERINNRLKQTRKEDKEQKEFAQTYEGGKYAHLYEGNYQGDETRKLVNERRRHQREIKTNAATIEHYKREVEKYTDPADKPAEATQEAPAAEAEQQPTETENAPQAATQAAEGIEITAITYTTDDDPDPAPGLLIHRPGTNRGIIIGDGVMLPDDPADLLTAYGEREYNQDAAGNFIITDAEPEHPATATEAATVAGIIRRKGGYRERDLLTRPHEMTHGETWNAEHKVVNVLSATPDPDGYRAGCAVDIVTRSIVG